MTNYADVASIPLKTAEKSIDFDFTRENLLAEDSQSNAGKDVIVRSEDQAPLGIISKRKTLLPYPEIMKWMVDEFNESGVEFKLKDSVITGKGEMFQEYLFNMPIDTPDGNPMSPRVVAKASYIGRPLDIAFGTYRFVCSNGALVGNTFESIVLRSQDLDGLSGFALRDDIKRGLDSMNTVAGKYQVMSETPMQDYLNEFLVDQKIGNGMKKKTLHKLEEMGTLTLPLEEDGIVLKGEHFENLKHPETLYAMAEEASGWDLYNNLTNTASHDSRSVYSQNWTDIMISRFFKI